MVLKLVKFLFLMLALTFVLSCVSRSEAGSQKSVQTQNRQWSELAQDYQISFRQLYFCLPDSIRPMRITVRDNRIVNVIFEDDQSQVPAEIIADLKTIDDIFQTIFDAQSLAAHRLKIEYDQQQYFPARVDIDYDDRLADDEIHWELSNLILLNSN
jgi:hypothetical protein